jgi:predicted O-methyltransferase YrrM
LYVLARVREPWPRTRAALEAAGVAVRPLHYYYPFVTRRDLTRPFDEERALPGLHLDATAHRAFLDGLRGLDEFEALLDADPASRPRFLDNGDRYGPGDADLYYAILRTLKPKRIVEVGSGMSTLVAATALARNAAEGTPGRMTCIEPYEQPWLEAAGVEVIRTRVEQCDPSTFLSLGAGDILFIDSSHVIRPQGDVLFEILSIVPRLTQGVYVHFHDIFTPYDYPESWIFDRGMLWNEQYLLEAFLSMNESYEIMFATFWMTRYDPATTTILPWLSRKPQAAPGSFWIRRL